MLSLGHRCRTCSQVFDIMFTSHDTVTSIQLSTNYNLTVFLKVDMIDMKTPDPKLYFCATEDLKDTI